MQNTEIGVKPPIICIRNGQDSFQMDDLYCGDCFACAYALSFFSSLSLSLSLSLSRVRARTHTHTHIHTHTLSLSLPSLAFSFLLSRSSTSRVAAFKIPFHLILGIAMRQKQPRGKPTNSFSVAGAINRYVTCCQLSASAVCAINSSVASEK
jgi:hypothetical protein